MIDVYRTTPADLRRIALERGRTGYSAASDGKQAGLIHHSKAGRTADGRYRNEVPGETKRVENRMIQQLNTGLPVLRRRSHQERFRSMFDRLAVTALDAYRRTGRVEWPASIQRELKELAWKNGDPRLVDFGGEDQVYRQVEALTRMYIEKSSNKQKAQDQKKSALDWHGHYAT